MPSKQIAGCLSVQADFELKAAALDVIMGASLRQI